MLLLKFKTMKISVSNRFSITEFPTFRERQAFTHCCELPQV